MTLSEWIIPEVDKEEVLDLAARCKITPFIALMFTVRNITSEKEIEEFLNITNNFSDPFAFTGMDKLVSRMEMALENHEKICIYGDYDVDGVTSTALMYLYFKEKGADIIFHIPTREKDGYGLNKNAISKLKEEGVQIIFTVDNGISSFDEIDFANSLGIDVVITDHHRIHEKLPNAVAIVNPHRPDCFLINKNFAGVGVAFKVIEAMEKDKTPFKELLKKYADLVTLGSIGDAIDIRFETANMVKIGIKNMNLYPRVGLKELFKITNPNSKKIEEGHIAFGICPRINACGRIDAADLAVELLICEDSEKAGKICTKIDSFNKERREIEIQMLEQIEQLLQREPKRKYERIIIAEGIGWHHGVLGIVSSRISKKYGKPCIIISIDEENAKGSARSIPGFSIHEAFSECSQYLERFGGHPMAAGINLKAENLEKFKKELLDYVNNIEFMPFQKLKIDCKLSPKAASKSLISQIDILRPFSNGNEEPLFVFLGVTLERVCSLSNGKHIRIIFYRTETRMEAVLFNQNFDDFLYEPMETLDLAVYLKRSEYMGFETVSVQMTDAKLSYVNMTNILKQKRIYERFLLGKSLDEKKAAALKPLRSDFADVYRYFKRNNEKNFRPDILSYRIFGTDENFGKICIIIDVMEELGIATFLRNGDEFRVSLNEITTKVNLDNSEILKRF